MTMSLGADLRRVCTVRPLPKGKGSVKFPVYGSVTAAALTEATDMSNTAVSTSSQTVTPGEYGVMTTLTDEADWESNPPQVGKDIGMLFGDAIKGIRNQTIWALFDGFSQTAGTTNTDIGETAIINCVQQLMNAKVKRPFYMPITPHVFEDLLTIYSTNTNLTAESIRNAVLNDGIMPPVYGVVPLLIDDLASGTSAGKRDGADAKCAVLATSALGFVEGFDLRIETQRDISLRGTELVAVSYFGVGEVNDTHGVELLVDNKD